MADEKSSKLGDSGMGDPTAGDTVGPKLEAESTPPPSEVKGAGFGLSNDGKNDTATKDVETPSHRSCPLQEHEVLHHLHSILPQKAVKGLFSMDIIYTSIDVSKEYIALSTNVGLIFLYDRLSQSLQKLKSPTRAEFLTAVKMRQSVDYVVAVGSENGRVYVFQLPSFLPGRAKQLQMYCVEELHVGKITCLEWSSNTEKLFSGDQDGNVICTEIDYDNNQSKSFSVCQEPHPIVQLSYAHKTLLISTTFRTVLWSSDACSKVKRIGTKDRKVLGDFGACFMPGSYKPEDAVLYVSRPGLRLWRADIAGTVLMTFMYRDLLQGKTPIIPILPETASDSNQSAIEEINLGPLNVFNDEYLVTWAKGSLLIIDPKEGKVLGLLNNIGTVRNLAVCGDEVYILRETLTRPVIRIATKKDPLNEPASSSNNSPALQKPLSSSSSSSALPNSPVHLFQQTADIMSSGFKAALQGVSDRIQEGQQVAAGAGMVPPWGFALGSAQKSVDEQDVDSCKEVSSASSVSSSVDLNSPVNKPTTSPDHPPSTTNNQPSPTSSRHLPETSSDYMHKDMNSGKNKAQPEIHLESDDVISVHIPQDVPDLAINEGIKMRTESTDDKLIDGPEETVQSERMTVIERLNNITSTGNDDIVFSPKPKKHKKKKHKPGGPKLRADDNLSVDSLEVASVTSADSNLDLHANRQDIDIAEDRENHTENNLDPNQKDTDPSISPDSLQTLENATTAGSAEDTPILPIEHLCEIEWNKLTLVDRDSQPSLAPENKAASTQGIGSNGKIPAKRPEDLSSVSRSKSDTVQSREATSLQQITKRASSPLGFIPLKPERSVSVPSPPDLDSSVTSASAISASYHEDMNQASFETYARQNSERSKSETPSPHEERRKNFYQTPDSSDDFYSKYQKDASNYSLDDIYSPSHEGNSIEDALDYTNVSSKLSSYSDTGGASVGPSASQTRPGKLELATAETDATDVMHKFSDTWTEMLAPGNLQSMCVTDRHVWMVDKSDRLHYSLLTGHGLTWRKVDESARQISVSRSGSIVWRLHQGSVYAGTKITTRAPAGLNWVEVLRKEVVYIAVDDTVAWYVKSNGDVMMQKGLSRERPNFRSIKIPSKMTLRQITCRNGVVWAVSDAQSLYMRRGVTTSKEEGTAWEPLDGSSDKLKVSSCAMGDDGTAWVIDTSGKVWFTTDVTSINPAGSGKWWEVAISEYVMNADSAMSLAMKPLTDFPLTKLMVPPVEKGGLISVGQSGVWVSQGYRHVLSICRGSLLGHRWEVTGPSGMASSARWLHVSACAASKTDGLIWAQQPNGAIFVFPPSLTGKVIEVSPPRPEMAPFTCMSANTDSVWALTTAGQVVVRNGMASHCPHGLTWATLDLVQLGHVKLVHLSCGSQNIWAVDNKGMVYQRIGNQPPDSSHLNPAWVPVEGQTHQAGAKFTKVYTGASDWMVWAIDSKKCVYVRVGVTDSMPIGTHWLYVPGTLGEDLTISERLVYSLNGSGELLVRYGILEETPAGDYWKKIPGKFRSISVTTTDNLWGINLEGQLCLRSTNFLKKKNSKSPYSPTRVNVAISDDWEVI